MPSRAVPEEVIPEEATTAVATTEEVIPEEATTAVAPIIMAVAAIIMAEVRASTSVDTSGSLTMPILTVIIHMVTPTLILTLTRIRTTLISMTSLRCISNRSNVHTGTTVGIQRVITPMSQAVRGAGRKWFPLHRERGVRRDEMATRSSVILYCGHVWRLRNDAGRSDRHGDARPGKAL
jgi:hypothetical protein